MVSRRSDTGGGKTHLVEDDCLNDGGKEHEGCISETNQRGRPLAKEPFTSVLIISNERQ